VNLPAGAVLLVLFALQSRAANTLDMYFIDVGPPDADSTLLVSPSGQSMLIDTGYPYHVERVLEMLRKVGVKQLDYLLITHFHHDHVSAIEKLVAAIPVKNIIDHGPSVETGKSDEWWYARSFQSFARQQPKEGYGKVRDQLYDGYLKATAGINRIAAKAGEKISIPGVDVLVLTSAGKTITALLPGAGAVNAACAQTEKRTEDDGEDEQSIGLSISFGSFRYVSLGDLAWGRIYALFCPRNLVGRADVWHVTHHGTRFAKSPDYSEYYWRRSSCLEAEMAGLHPTAAILSAADKAGTWGTNAALRIIRGLLPKLDVWETQYVNPGITGDKNDPGNYNSSEQLIADLTDKNEELRYIKLEARADGSYVIGNSRNGYTKAYPALTRHSRP
jgi:competence protein ComEC